MKKFLAVLIILTMLLSLTFLAFGNVELSEQETEQFIKNQEIALKTYDKIIMSIEKNKSKYVDSFGGAFINSKGNLVLLVTNNESKETGQLKKLINSEGVHLQNVEYSINDLTTYKEQLSKMNTRFADDITEIVGISLSPRDNQLVVTVSVLDDSIKKILNENYASDVIYQLYEKGEDTADIKNGGTLTVQKNGSVGFGAYRNGVKGIVSCGHYTGMYVNQIVQYEGSSVGTVEKINFKTVSYSDSSFIKTYSWHNPTNDVVSYYEFTGYSTSVVQGAMVYAAGITSGVRNGYITDVSYDDNDWDGQVLYDYIKTSIPGDFGDSGGPIWYPASGTRKGTLIGIQKGKSGTNSVFSKIENIIWDLGLDSIITN